MNLEKINAVAEDERTELAWEKLEIDTATQTWRTFSVNNGYEVSVRLKWMPDNYLGYPLLAARVTGWGDSPTVEHPDNLPYYHACNIRRTASYFVLGVIKRNNLGKDVMFFQSLSDAFPEYQEGDVMFSVAPDGSFEPLTIHDNNRKLSSDAVPIWVIVRTPRKVQEYFSSLSMEERIKLIRPEEGGVD